MLDGGLDQASGLRRLFARRALRVLPVASERTDASATRFVANLAAALARTGLQTIVVDGRRDGVAGLLGLCPTLDLADLLTADLSFERVVVDSPQGFSVLPATHGLPMLGADPAAADAVFSALAALGRGFEVALVHADGATLGPLLGRAGAETTLVCGADDENLTAVYGRIKALVTTHGMSRFRVVFDRAGSPLEAVSRHRRLASVAHRYLSASVEFGGLVLQDDSGASGSGAPAAGFTIAAGGRAARSFERIASAAREWQLPAFDRAGPTIH
jgi:flagellar biosynthesis protein FlhG